MRLPEDVYRLPPEVGIFVMGGLESLELVQGGRFPGFRQATIRVTEGGYQVRPTFNEKDLETGEETSVWGLLKGVEACGQLIVARVGIDRRNPKHAAARRALAKGASPEEVNRLLGGYVNFRLLRVVQLGGVTLGSGGG